MLGTHRRFAFEKDFKYDTPIRGGVSTLHDANGKGEEIGPATTLVSIVHSEHPSGGAHGTELLRSDIQNTWIFSKNIYWGKNWQFFFGAPKTAMKTLGGV